MATAPNKPTIYRLLMGMVLLTAIFVYSCNNNSAPKETTKDSSAATAPAKDTAMKPAADTSKTDTSGKGGQTPPPSH